MTKKTEEYMVWVDFTNTGAWEELLNYPETLEEVFEYYKNEVCSSYSVKVTEGDEDVTQFFDSLLSGGFGDVEEYYEESNYDFQYNEAKLAGHFS